MLLNVSQGSSVEEVWSGETRVYIPGLVNVDGGGKNTKFAEDKLAEATFRRTVDALRISAESRRRIRVLRNLDEYNQQRTGCDSLVVFCSLENAKLLSYGLLTTLLAHVRPRGRLHLNVVLPMVNGTTTSSSEEGDAQKKKAELRQPSTRTVPSASQVEEMAQGIEDSILFAGLVSGSWVSGAAPADFIRNTTQDQSTTGGSGGGDGGATTASCDYVVEYCAQVPSWHTVQDEFAVEGEEWRQLREERARRLDSSPDEDDMSSSDEDSSDEDEEEDDVVADLPSRAKAPGKEGFKKKKKACPDCSCGAKDTEGAAAAQDSAEALEEQAKRDEALRTGQVESSCGSCYLGDAFRCGSCAYTGLPAFDPTDLRNGEAPPPQKKPEIEDMFAR